MTETRRQWLLKSMALAGIFTFFYPLALVLHRYFFQRYAGISSILLYFLPLLLGFLHTSRWWQMKLKLVKGLLIISIPAALIFVSCILYREAGVGKILFYAAGTLFFYILGFRAGRREFGDILSYGMIIAGTVILLGSLGVSVWAEDYFHLRIPLILLFYTGILCTVFVKNQEKIDWALKQKGVDPTQNTAQIRKYNSFLIAGLCMIMIFLLNAKNMVAAVLFVVSKGVIRMIGLMFDFLTWINHLLEFKPHKPAGQSPIPPKPESTGAGGNSFLDYILVFVFVAVILFILYKTLPLLLRWLKSVIARIAVWFRKRGRTAVKNAVYEDDYEDDIEMIKVPEEGQRWGTHAKKVRKMGDTREPAGKVRFLYKQILLLFVRHGIGIEKFDTTGEIYMKSFTAGDVGRDFGDVTYSYEQVRYGNEQPSGKQVEAMESALKRIKKNLKGNRNGL